MTKFFSWRARGRQLLVLGLILTNLGWSPEAGATDNPLALYNQACRESLAGNLDAATTALDAALDAGFDDIRFALRDPDLANLHPQPAFQALMESRLQKLAELSDQAEFTLESQVWSTPRPLTTTPLADTGSGPADSPSVSLKWVSTGLLIKAVIPADWPDFGGKEALAPWAGGSTLLVNLTIIDGTSACESANPFLFAFGNDQGQHVGAVYQEMLEKWQPVRELAPLVENGVAGADHLLTATIPWQTILPFHPLTDPVMGVNIYLRMGPKGAARRARLFPDPRVADPTFPVKRFVPVRFQRETEVRESFLGRLRDSIVGPHPQEIQMAALSAAAGPGRLTIDFLDNRNRSVLPDGALTSTVELTAGLNAFTRMADFTNLQQGPYLLRADLALPSGRATSWSRTLLRLDEPWSGQLAARLENIPAADHATVNRQAAAIGQALARHLPRRNPSPIIKALTDLETMLSKGERTGSILPDSGPFRCVYPGPDGEERLCSLYLPAGYADAVALNPVLILNDARGAEPQLISRLGHSYDYHRDQDTSQAPASGNVPVYLVPHLPTATGDIRAAAVAEALAVLDWAATYFQTPQINLVGVDFSGGTALKVAQERPAKVGRLVVFAGGDLTPYPGATRDFLRDRFSPAPDRLPVTWIDFEQESRVTEQPALLFSILEEVGYNIVATQSVRGGLDVTQVADRLYLWAEGLR